LRAFLGRLPGGPARLLDQARSRVVQPLPRPWMSPLADLQLSLVDAPAPLHQIQTHRLAVRRTARILPGVADAAPQHTGRRYTDDLSLRLQDSMALRQLPSAPLPPPHLPPCLQGLPRIGSQPLSIPQTL